MDEPVDNSGGLTDAAASFHDPSDRCVVCGSTRNLQEYNGDPYCSQHLQERMARETGER